MQFNQHQGFGFGQQQQQQQHIPIYQPSYIQQQHVQVPGGPVGLDLAQVEQMWRQRLAAVQQEEAERNRNLVEEISRLQNRCQQLQLENVMMRAGASYDFRAFCEKKAINGLVPFQDILSFTSQYGNGMLPMPDSSNSARKRVRDPEECEPDSPIREDTVPPNRGDGDTRDRRRGDCSSPPPSAKPLAQTPANQNVPLPCSSSRKRLRDGDDDDVLAEHRSLQPSFAS